MELPILRDIPESFTTARLRLRCPVPGDGAVVNAAVLESLDELKPWMPWAEIPPAVWETEANLRAARSHYIARTELRLLLFHRETGDLVGSSGLHALDWSIPKCEIGYWCRTQYAGQGYISEAVRGITRFAFTVLGAERVGLRCDARNERSRQVAERVGFVLEGRLRREERERDGFLSDTLIFSLLREEFAALQLPPITCEGAEANP